MGADEETKPPSETEEKSLQTTETEHEAKAEVPAETPPELDMEGFEKMPPDVKKMFQMYMMRFSSGPFPNPIMEKVNEKHIDKFLDNKHDSEKSEFGLRHSGRWFTLGYVAIGVFVLMILARQLLPANKDIFVQILTILFVGASALGGGYGLKAYHDRKR